MSDGITLAEAQAKLITWMAADDAVALKQSYSIEGRSLTLADAALINRNVDYWRKVVARKSSAAAGRSRLYYGEPR